MTVEAIANRLRGDVDLEYRFVISIQGFTIGVSSNSEALIQQLTSYFGHLVVNAERWDCQVEAIEGSIDLSDEGWTDWPREAGKSGRKEAYIDGENFSHLAGSLFVAIAQPMTTKSLTRLMRNS